MKPDVQWSRFQVFLQEAIGKPHQDVGTVHAPDAELALLNARDVFARRPACISMWVAPVEAIYSKTIEELDNWNPNQNPLSSGQVKLYHVFSKETSACTHILVGVIEAESPEIALSLAIDRYSKQSTPFSWWIISDRAIKKSDPIDVASFYSPARDKAFRMATDFKVLTKMRQIKRSTDKGYIPDE